MQQASKEQMDQGWLDTFFLMGDKMLLWTNDLSEIGKLQPRWEGPFRVIALAGPNTCTLALPQKLYGERGVPQVSL